MRIRPSPTLSQAERVAALRSEGVRALALSNPTFSDRGPQWTDRLPELSTLLTPVSGLPMLREALRDFLFPRWDLPGHGTVVTSGAKAALYAILRYLCVPNDEVVIISPHWPSYDDLALMGFFQARHFHTRAEEGFRVDAERLERFIAGEAPAARVIMLSNPNNPTGRVYGADELDALLDLAESLDIALVLDESFSQIVHEPEQWQASRTRPSRNLYLVNSCSKNFHLQGLRLGLGLVPDSAIQDIAAIHQTLNGAASSVSQHLMLWYLGQTERRGPVAGDLRAQRERMWQFIQEASWDCFPSAGTFYFFPRIAGIPDFHDRIERLGVFALPGRVFGSPYHEHVRLCFGRDLEELETLLQRVREALE